MTQQFIMNNNYLNKLCSVISRDMAERELTLREQFERLTWLNSTTGHPYYLDPDVSMKAYNAVRREVSPVQHVFHGYHLTTPCRGCPEPLLHANGRYLGRAVSFQLSNGEIKQVLTSRSDQVALEEFGYFMD